GVLEEKILFHSNAKVIELNTATETGPILVDLSNVVPEEVEVGNSYEIGLSHNPTTTTTTDTLSHYELSDETNLITTTIQLTIIDDELVTTGQDIRRILLLSSLIFLVN